jgi:MPBQ/MSBQ methyltransferase
MRLVQHKKEAYWFYRFLSFVYDDFVNPFFWNVRMREEALVLARLDDPSLETIDVGAGTGFTTEGIVRRIAPNHVIALDQSPHQLARARARASLKGCRILEGDAEELPFGNDRFDRYVSAGSIEYWPDPQRAVAEAYRVLRKGGRALVVGPLRPEGPFARAVADLWMLFPEVHDYERWFREGGFVDIEMRYIAPSWVQREAYGLAIAGVKPADGPSPLPLVSARAERLDAPASPWRRLQLGARVVAGSAAGFLFIPAAIWGHIRALFDRPRRPSDPLTPHQVIGIALFTTVLVWAVAALFGRRR